MTKLETDIVELSIKSQLTGKLAAPIVITGAPGTGKSSSIKGIADKLNMNLLNVSMASISIEELTGIPTFSDADNFEKYATVKSNKHIATQWSVPELIVSSNLLAED